MDGARALGAAGGNMGGMANQDRALGTPYGKHPTRALLLGSGELGKEVAIALTRLGVRVIAADSYEGAPAQQVAHEAHVLDMSDAQALAELIAEVQPDIIIPEIEAIATQVLFDAERAGIHVVPSATIASICMDREALRRRAAFRERCPELLFNRYAIEGLNPAQTTYVRDNMQLDHQHDGEPKILSFERVKDKYFSVLADGNFSTEYPYMRYDPKSGYYGIDFRLTTKPDYKILIGGNISSTAFNQAYVGFEYHRIRHAANRYYTHLFLGPVSSAVMLGGRTDFFLWRPLFVDYSYNFTARNYKNGNFGNLTSVSNTESMKFLENFLSLGFGFPVTHRSAFVIRLNGGQERYYYSLDRASYKENYYEDLTTLNYISPKIELRRSSLDRMIFPHSGTSLSLSGIYLYGRDRFVPSPYSRDEQRLRKSKRDVSWWGARIVWNQYFQISGSKWFSLGYGAEAVVTTIPTLSNDKVTRMLMPAYRPTLHSQTVYMPEYRAKRYAAVSVMPTFDFSDRFFLRTGIYAMFAERFRPTDDRMRYIVDASLVYHTGIGPISLSLTKYNVKNWDNLFLTFNFGYAMFRPRGIHY